MNGTPSQGVVVEQQHGLLCCLWVAEGDEPIAHAPAAIWYVHLGDFTGLAEQLTQLLTRHTLHQPTDMQDHRSLVLLKAAAAAQHPFLCTTT
jgi:hypothetical protein